MRTQLIAAMVCTLVFGLTAMAQTTQVDDTETARISAETTQAPCEGQTPKGDRIGPRDRTRGANPPRDGRGIGRGQAHGRRDGLGVGPARGARRGQGFGPRDGSGMGRGQGWGMCDGRGPGRGQRRGGGQRQGPRDGTGPNCPVN